MSCRISNKPRQGPDSNYGRPARKLQCMIPSPNSIRQATYSRLHAPRPREGGFRNVLVAQGTERETKNVFGREHCMVGTIYRGHLKRHQRMMCRSHLRRRHAGHHKWRQTVPAKAGATSSGDSTVQAGLNKPRRLELSPARTAFCKGGCLEQWRHLARVGILPVPSWGSIGNVVSSSHLTPPTRRSGWLPAV